MPGIVRSVQWHLCVMVIGLSGVCARGEAIGKGAAGADAGASFVPVLVQLEKEGGKMDPAVRAAYLNWAEQTVLGKVRAAGQSIPADCLAEVDADPTLRGAMFGAIDPPDPSILENYAKLRSELGPAFMGRYRALVTAQAVATRANGARAQPGLVPKGEEPLPDADEAPQGAPSALAGEIASYMKQSGVSAQTLYESDAERGKLVAFLQQKKMAAGQIGRAETADSIFPLLKQAMILLGQRPAYRQAAPDEVAWLRYLASVYEAKPISPAGSNADQAEPWPRFPMGSAPWPLLMPLYRTYPLGEATYIWEKYEGLHGPDRYHTYGPYRGGDRKEELELEPSAWHWNAWPDVIIHGGVCTTMAPMSVETHITLCEPAVMAAQPHHSNLISFRNAGGYWYTVIEQPFAGGPGVTHGGWLFNEAGTAPGIQIQNGKTQATADYQMGLAQAMNTGLAQYMDTRIAVNLYHHLPASESGTPGKTLLTQAIQINPYNAALWHLLGRQTKSPEEGINLVKLAMAEAQAAESGTDGGPAQEAVPKPEASSVEAYWNVLEQKLASEAVLSHPIPSEKAAAQRIYGFLKTVPGVSDTRDMAYLLNTQGPEGEETKLQNAVEQYLDRERGSDRKGTRKRFGAELAAFLAAASKDEGTAFLTHLKSLLAASGPDDSYLQIVDAARPGRM